jgi:hypothetical protein
MVIVRFGSFQPYDRRDSNDHYRHHRPANDVCVSFQARPTPAHLTSVQAEQILATACENESDNAKRMRIGLEPVSQPMPTLPAATVSNNHARGKVRAGGGEGGGEYASARGRQAFRHC